MQAERTRTCHGVSITHLHEEKLRMNTLTQTLIAEIQAAPQEVQQEVFDFLEFLKARRLPTADRENLLPLAQAAWAAEWESPEENEAWRSL
jgi:hypothetical protein